MAFRPILCSGRTTAFADPAKKIHDPGTQILCLKYFSMRKCIFFTFGYIAQILLEHCLFNSSRHRLSPEGGPHAVFFCWKGGKNRSSTIDVV